MLAIRTGMKFHRMVVAILKYNRLARLVGSGWYHLDRYGESETPRGKAGRITKAFEAGERFASQTQGMACVGEPVRMGSCANAMENEGEGADARLQAAGAMLLACADILRRNRPKAVRYVLPLFLAVACALVMATYAVSTLSLMCSNKGLQVSYFKGRQFDKKAMAWTERSVAKDYGTARPCLLCPAGEFSARWEGFLVAPKDDDYSFYAQSIGGLRLMIDDEVVIDDWDEHGWIPGKPGHKRLAVGAHRIRIEYYHARNNAALRIRWCGGGIPSNTVLGGEYLKKR